MRSRSSLLLICALGAGSGCDTTVAPLSVGSDCPDRPIREPTAEEAENPAGQMMVSDFENGETSSSPPNPYLNSLLGRDGTWVAGAAATSIVYGAGRSDACPARGSHAGHFWAHNLASWGVNWNAAFRATSASSAVAYDAKAYGGISLWAAFAPGQADVFAVRVGISTMDTAHNAPICVPPNCSDHYLTTIEPSREWQLFHLRFDAMKQIGYGEPQVPTMRKDQMVAFVIWPLQPFDLWIDDVRFEP